jgi:hypothetical protein
LFPTLPFSILDDNLKAFGALAFSMHCFFVASARIGEQERTVLDLNNFVFSRTSLYKSSTCSLNICAHTNLHAHMLYKCTGVGLCQFHHHFHLYHLEQVSELHARMAAFVE